VNRGAFGACRVGYEGVTDRCALCATGYGHSPRVQVYDREAGDYVALEGDVCTARWATTGMHHIEGEICGEPATEKAGDFLLCEYHRDRLFGWSHKRTLWGIGEIRDAQIAADRERIREEEAELAKRCIVYYLQRESDGLIKIGSTTGARSRFSKLKTDYGPLRLMATRGGKLQQEREAQDKFDEFLAETREWFRPELRLLRHILRLRTQYEVREGTGAPIVETAEIRAMIRAAMKAKAAPGTSQTALAVSCPTRRDGP
jgi:hypothetical protein